MTQTIALESPSTDESAKTKTALLVRLLDASRRLSETRKLDPLLNQAMEVALMLFGAEMGFLILLDEKDRLDFRVSRTREGKLITQPAEQISQTILSQVIQGQQNLIIADASSEPDLGIMESVLHLNIRSVMCVPLITRGQTLGAIYLENRSMAGVFSEKDLPALKLFASQVAVAVENAMLNERLEALVARRTSALASTNQELEQRVGDMRLFSRALAHDLKTPLGVIMGYAGLLEEYIGRLSSDDQLAYTAAILRGSEKINQIIDGLLLLATIREQADVEISVLNMDKILTEALEQLSHMSASFQATITRPPEWPAALGFAPWVEEIWVNYLTNALKYGGEPPVIELGAEVLPHNWVRFWVRDHGPGIAEEEQELIFAPFTRLDQVKVGSHGLGLPIVRQIITRLNGSVGIQSSLGQGSQFYFILPAA